MRIAVVGSGISGLAAAWMLDRCHDVTLYERDTRAGGHSRTVDVDMGQETAYVYMAGKRYRLRGDVLTEEN